MLNSLLILEFSGWVPNTHCARRAACSQTQVFSFQWNSSKIQSVYSHGTYLVSSDFSSLLCCRAAVNFCALVRIHPFQSTVWILSSLVNFTYFKSLIIILFHLALFRDWARKNHLELHSCMLWVKLLSNCQNTTQTTKVFEAVCESLF